MSMRRRQFTLGLLVTAGLQGLARADDGVQHEQRALMGTRVRITLIEADAARRRAAFAAAWARMQSLADQMSRYREGSVVRQLAAQAGGAPLRVSPETMQVLLAAREVAAFTEGAFDASVGAYRDWHFGDDAAGGAPEIVDARRLGEQRRLVDWRRVELDAHALSARLPARGMALDLGGIAKLPILQAGLAEITRAGVAAAMIDGGGDVVCRGGPPGRDWRVGIRDPRAPQRLVGVVTLRDGVVASSGDYERFFDRAGRRWHHVLDPATGWPTQGVHGVALLAHDVGALNGLGAAIMVGGLERGQRWLARRPGVDALIATDASTWLSPGMQARLAPAG